MAPGLEVTGVDLSEEMLVQAEKHTQKLGLDNRVRYRQGDAAEIPFPDASCDLAVSTLSLHHWSDPIAVLDEVARVLRPGGAFLIFDVRRDMAAPFYLLFWFVTRYIAPSALRRVNEPLGSRNAAYTPEEAKRLIWRSQLSGGHLNAGPFWFSIEGIKP
jgi:ubiquinone/menaquinone biosynthesis C-methylase UbiE